MPPTVPFLLDAKQLLSHSEPPIVQPRTWNGQQIHGEVDFRRWGIRLGSARTFSWSVLFVLLIKDSDFWGWRGNLKIYVAHIHPVAILLRVLWSNCQTNKLTLFHCVDHILFEVWTPSKIFDSSCRFTQQPSQAKTSASQLKASIDLT